MIFFQKFYFSQRFLLRRALEVIVGTNLVLALMQQWIVPGIVNSLIPFSVSILFRRVYILEYTFILICKQKTNELNNDLKKVCLHIFRT